ncbi:MAG: DUF1501 domain-containing protein [Chloroflexi bacterium]|nr:DUF1501 domain-containing protein [Chloroflexota bacterium]
MFDTLKRRQLLKKSGVLALGMMTFPAWMPRIAFRSPPATNQTHDLVVVVFLRGGADGLNIVVPHGDRDYYGNRDALAIAQPKARDDASAIDLDGFFGLHPKLRPLKELWDARVLAAIHAVGSPDPTHSHFDAMDYMERGTPGDKALPTGWIGRHLQIQAANNRVPFRAVGLGTLVQQSLRGPIPTMALQSIADFHLRGETQELARIQQTIASLYEGNEFLEIEGQETLAAMDTLAKIAKTKYAPANGARYPQGYFGQALATLAQLIKAQVGVEVAAVDIGGWDTHQAEGGGDGQMARLLQEFADGLRAFYTDMEAQMKKITLVTMSEFGRRVRENSSRGTDHGHGGVMFVLGGSVNGGKMYGDWPSLAQEKLYGPGDLAVTTDFRDVLGELLQKRAGNQNLAAVFPNHRTFSFRGLVRA